MLVAETFNTGVVFQGHTVCITIARVAIIIGEAGHALADVRGRGFVTHGVTGIAVTRVRTVDT